MSRIVLRHAGNEMVNFLRIVNFLVSCKIMSLEEGVLLHRRFKSAKDVVFDIPDEMTSRFSENLNSPNCKYETAETGAVE